MFACRCGSAQPFPLRSSDTSALVTVAMQSQRNAQYFVSFPVEILRSLTHSTSPSPEVAAGGVNDNFNVIHIQGPNADEDGAGPAQGVLGQTSLAKRYQTQTKYGRDRVSICGQ